MRLLSPQELRESMVRDYQLAYQRAGVIESTSRLMAEARAMTELEIVAAAERAGEIGGRAPGARVEVDEPGKHRPDPLAQAYAEVGAHRPSGDVVKFRAIHDRPQNVSERWGYATMRITRILEGAGRAATIEASVKDAQIPALAKKFADLWGWFQTFGGPPPPLGRVDPNPFRGLSPKDASRKFMRLVEDICDQSTGVLGSWYVK